MSNLKATRSSKPRKENSAVKSAKAPAFLKVFYITESLLNSKTAELQLERFYHPGHSQSAWFITQQGENKIMEVLEFAEPRRSWLVNNEVCSNGRLYVTTPIDVTFLALHHIRKHCSSKALELDTIHDNQDASVNRLLTKFVPQSATLGCIADVRSVGDMTFYKYNQNKTLSWLSLKAKYLSTSLRNAGIYCGHSALSENYLKSDLLIDDQAQEEDFLRMACDVIGGYLDLDLHEELARYLNLTTEMKSRDENDLSGKRKSASRLSDIQNKKIKLETNNESQKIYNGAIEKINNSSLLDESLENEYKDDFKSSISPVVTKPTPLKERILSAKEKALAKGAKGTKSITSFFRK